MILGPEGMLLLLDIVQRLVAMQEIERAMYFLQALQPKCLSEYNLKIAQIFVAYSEESRAISFLQTVLEENPSAEPHFQLAEIYSHLGRPTEAEQHYKQALELDPDNPRYYVRLINLYTAWRQNLLKEALAKYPENYVFQKLAEEVSVSYEPTN